MKKIIRYFIIYTLLVALPFLAFITAGECVPNRYDNAFTTALIDKYRRLIETDERKIVFVGGSSLPFGLRSDLVEEELDYRVVDFGVYASLGTKAMMEFSLANLNQGDVVVLAPELSAQTYSLYFNADVTWQAVNQKRSMIRRLSWDERQQMAYNYLQFLYEKMRISSGEGVPKEELYARSSFDKYGDIVYPRPGNIMPGGYDRSQPITLDFETKAFATYVNEYAATLAKKGVSLYFAFSPTNAEAKEFDEAQETQFVQDWQDAISCPLLGTVADFTYDAKYFYNTNYHLNDAGAVLHTVRLIDALKRQLGIDAPTDVVIPTIEEAPIDEPEAPADPNERFFAARAIGGAYYLTQVLPEYRTATSLTLPKTYDGHEVSGIAANCFEGCAALQTLTIPDNYRVYEIGCFMGCGNLTTIYLDVETPGATSIPDEGLFDGAAPTLTVYVKPESYTAFISNYTWSRYKEHIKKKS